VKPNYTVALSGNTPEIKLEHKKFALFVGRLSPEKGIEFLIDSWSELGYQLYIVGSGPELELVKNLDSDNITILGQLGQREVRALMRSAKFLVMTSVWYEGFPMILSEAFESSLPAIVPNHGSMGTIIMHEENGLKYIAGNKASFRATVARLFEDNRLRKKLSLGAKKSYVSYYSEAENVSQLMEIYRTVIAKRNLTLESHK
jgi:glycosyltransferase involved in cell wall biosynthesis